MVLLNISNVDHAEHFRQVQEEIGKIFSVGFLRNCTGSKKLSLIQYIARVYTDFLLKASTNKAIYGVANLQRAALTLQSNPEQVTCFHSCFAKLCLKAKCYQHALKLIEQSATEVQTGTEAIEILTYNYYRGMLYTGLKRFDDSIACFNRVLSLPAKIFHRVHLESYKKLCLLLLIAPSNETRKT
jgi:tetratricopeptide (TPR) repeat protein